MFKQKSLILGLAATMLAGGLSACNQAAADLTYWCTSVDNDVMVKIVAAFKEDNPQYADKRIELGANYGEGDAYTNLSKSLANAGDVIFVADDNIRSGVDSRLLTDLSEDKDAFVASDGQFAVNACSVDGKMYAYPYRSDNSPMPFYDKATFTSNPAALNSIEGMLDACEKAGKKFYLDIANGWYNAFMIWAAGAQFTVGTGRKGTEVILNDVVAKKNQVGEVLKALKALYNRYQDTWEISSDNGIIQDSFGNETAGVAFLWNDGVAIKAKTSREVGVAQWPTLAVSGQNVALKCFQSYKAIVCKRQDDTERLALAKAFAKYCASYKAQEMRLELDYGPSNLELMQTAQVNALEFPNAIKQMNNAGRTVDQATNVTGAFWKPMEDLGGMVCNGLANLDDGAWGAYPTAVAAAAGSVAIDGWEATTF